MNTSFLFSFWCKPLLFYAKRLPGSTNHSEYRFLELHFIQNSSCLWFQEFRLIQIVLNITKWSSIQYKTFWTALTGVPESVNLFELWFQEFLQALFFLNRTKWSSRKHKSIRFALSEAPLSLNSFWLNNFEILWA